MISDPTLKANAILDESSLQEDAGKEYGQDYIHKRMQNADNQMQFLAPGKVAAFFISMFL